MMRIRLLGCARALHDVQEQVVLCVNSWGQSLLHEKARFASGARFRVIFIYSPRRMRGTGNPPVRR
jgi:hypothetical protein